jgi:DNA-binding transcriptional MerR regulator
MVHLFHMDSYSTRQAAKRLGLPVTTLARYIAHGKVPTPKTVSFGGMRVHLWSEADIERVRAMLPKIANGRKTRYKKQGKKQTDKKSKR